MALLLVVLLPLFAVTVAVSQYTMDHTSDLFEHVLAVEGSTRPGRNDIGAVGRAFILAALCGYGPVFLLQGLPSPRPCARTWTASRASSRYRPSVRSRTSLSSTPTRR